MTQNRFLLGALVLVSRQVLGLGLMVTFLALGDLVSGRQAKRLFAPLGASLALSLSISIPALAEEEENPLGQDPSNVIPLIGAEPMDLLGPASGVLSGQAWMMAAGSLPPPRPS